jgi:hypothetical protein
VSPRARFRRLVTCGLLKRRGEPAPSIRRYDQHRGRHGRAAGEMIPSPLFAFAGTYAAGFVSWLVLSGLRALRVVRSSVAGTAIAAVSSIRSDRPCPSVSGARRRRQPCVWLLVLPGSAVRAAVATVPAVLPYGRSPLPVRARSQWIQSSGITSPERLAGRPSPPLCSSQIRAGRSV